MSDQAANVETDRAYPNLSEPGIRRGGRQKGTPNKINSELREMILGALDEAGGQGYLVKQAEENPKAFLTLLSRVLPTTVGVGQSPDLGPIVVKWDS